MSDAIDRQAAKDAATKAVLDLHRSTRCTPFSEVIAAAIDSLPSAREERPSLAAELLADLDLHWQFDDGQVHTHTWHTKQDFLEKWRKRLSPPAEPNDETCPECGHELTTMCFHCAK